MLRFWSSSRRTGLILAAGVLALGAGPALAVPDLDSEFESGYNDFSFDVTSIVATIPSGGYTIDIPVGTDPTVGASYEGYYVYVYHVYVDDSPDFDPDERELAKWFQVDWEGFTPVTQGDIDATSDGSTVVVNWSWQGLLEAAAGGGTPPEDPGTWLSWKQTGTVNSDYAIHEGNWIGTFWAISPSVPKVGDGLVANEKPTNATGDVYVPTPELPSLLLLLTSGAPMLGIGYLRKRKPV